MPNRPNRHPTCYVLRVIGQRGLKFKAKNHSQAYLEELARTMLAEPKNHYTSYEIHKSDASNNEMTTNNESAFM
ncbi:MAG: hypothetical protein JXK16_00885 [Thiotrichales bacterium]|nr:hypothetical protein [Thiotrichales bacterium]